MVQFDNVGKRFGDRLLFSEASFHLQKGEKCALLGNNGSGKTTLLRMLAGIEEPDEGMIRLPKGYRFGWLKQHLQFEEGSLLEEAVKGLPLEKHYLAERFLQGLGFQKEDFSKHPSLFSGGYQLRLHLCQVLLSEPNGLLLDEPTNYLDLPSIRWMQEFLSSWKGELIVISHERSFIDAVCTACLGIHRGKIKKVTGKTDKFYQTIFQEEEVYEKTRVNQEKKKAHLEKFVVRFGATASKASQAQSRVKALERMTSLEKLVELKALDFVFPAAPFAGRQLLKASNLSFSYTPSQKEIITNFSLEIEKGERIAIIGKNGRGKSTLLKLLAQECLPCSGEIKYAEAVKVGYFGQTHIDRLQSDSTIEEEIGLAAPELSTEAVRALCGKMLFDGDLAKKKIQVLSGGEKSRVLLGKLLASPSNLLLLDEPTHHLDMESVEALMEALKNFEGAIVIVTHSEEVLHAITPSKLIICRENSQEVFLGDYARFLETRGWEETPSITLQKEKKNKEEKPHIPVKKKNTLGALEKEINRLETTWLHLEEELETLQRTLVELADVSTGHSEEIHKLSLLMHDKKKESDALFDKLTLLNQQKLI